jgi:hypothetical protein
MSDQHYDTTIPELVALDPPTAGTKASGNPLATADLIMGVFLDEPDTKYIVYGKHQLERVIYSKKTKAMLKIVVRLDTREELDVLCAMVAALRGKHDLGRKRVALSVVGGE